MLARIACLVGSICMSVGSARAAGFAAGPAWLDAPTPTAWNAPGAKIPLAPRSAPDAQLARQCGGQLRKAASAADQAVAAAGWKLLGASQRFGELEVVGGQSGFDGMCRPLGYQFFVFSDGRFAGTLAPGPMDSRTDASAQIPHVVSTRELAATFSRYTPSDPLCCPSSVTTVRYRLESTEAGPVLLPTGATTARTGELQAIPAATSAASDAGVCAPAPAAPAAACAPGSPVPTPPAAAIAMRVWQLVRIQAMDGAVHVPDHPAKYTLELGGDGRASVRADCNRGTASYLIDGPSLAFGPISTTRATCSPGSLSDRYLQQLGLVASYLERDGKLHLATRTDGAVLDFQPAPGPDGLVSPTERCARAGGTVASASCCKLVGDFPNTCLMGACGCAPEHSHQVQVCRCPGGRCFDGKACVDQGSGRAGQLR
jgi:heat shock protein HslJ